MDEGPLIQRASLALLAMLFVGAFTSTQVSAKEVPKKPNPTKTASVTPSLTFTPMPTATQTPSPTPTITNTPTPDPNDVEYWTTLYTVEIVMLWEPYARMIIEQYEYDLDLALVLSVMAAESGGDASAVSYAGACNLMQVIPKTWFPESKKAICGSAWTNMVVGMRILQGALGMAEDRDLPIEFGISFYNCSEKGVMTDMCGEKGGLFYSEQVLNHWLPLFEERLKSEY